MQHFLTSNVRQLTISPSVDTARNVPSTFAVSKPSRHRDCPTVRAPRHQSRRCITGTQPHGCSVTVVSAGDAVFTCKLVTYSHGLSCSCGPDGLRTNTTCISVNVVTSLQLHDDRTYLYGSRRPFAAPSITSWVLRSDYAGRLVKSITNTF